MVHYQTHKPPIGNQVKHILIILSLLFLTFPLVAQETGVLYLKKVNGKFGWFENGIGEWKDGKYNGQGTYTSQDGTKGKGEFKDNTPWNISLYGKYGNFTGKYVNGVKQ